MDKPNILYVIFFISVIVMIITLRKIIKQKTMKKSSKAILIYLTVIIPFLGFFLTSSKGK